MSRHGSQETGFYPSPIRSCGSWSLEWLAELKTMPPSRNLEFCICKAKSSYKNSGLKSYWIAEYILLLESLSMPHWRKFSPRRKSRTIYVVSLSLRTRMVSSDWQMGRSPQSRTFYVSDPAFHRDFFGDPGKKVTAQMRFALLRVNNKYFSNLRLQLPTLNFPRI